MISSSVQVVIENNDANMGLTKNDEGLSSTSLFEVNRLASLKCKFRILF